MSEVRTSIVNILHVGLKKAQTNLLSMNSSLSTCAYIKVLILKLQLKEFPGNPAVRTLHSHCWGPRFDPWSGN